MDLGNKYCLHYIGPRDKCASCDADRKLALKGNAETSVEKVFKGKHVKGCRSIVHVENGTWNSPWVLPDTHWLDTRACRTGRTTCWIGFRCNDPDCAAMLYVLEDDLLAAIGEKYNE